MTEPSQASEHKNSGSFDVMHPIERLRYVARATDDGPTMLVREAAGALASFSSDPAALVTACRRLVDRQPQAGAIWWLAARVLASPDPDAEAWTAAGDLDADDTPSQVRDLVPEDARVLIIGWPELAASGLARRGDVTIMVGDALDEGSSLVRRLERSGHLPLLVDERGIASAAADADLVLLEAVGLGATGIVATIGSLAAAASAHQAGVAVWATCGVGRVLPGRLWDAYLRRLEQEGDPWDRDAELVPLGLISQTVTPEGLVLAANAPMRADCPIAAELLKSFD